MISMGAVLVVHLVVGVGLLLGRPGRPGLLIGGLAPVVALAWTVGHLPAVLDGRPVVERTEWVPTLGLAFDLRVDGFAMLMVLVVAGIGVGVLAYGWSYFSDDDAAEVDRTAGLLVLFAGAMLGVVVADNLLVLYGAWELTSVLSFLLVGNQFRKAEARAAAQQAILMTGAGGLCLLLGLVVLGRAAGTYRMSEVLADPPSGTAVPVALVLVAVGAFTQSAPYPVHSWLPRAMVAPTPVSAYLHSATMVKAGVYVIARFAPAFAASQPGWRALVVAVGAWSMLAGGVRALREHDLKLVLAYGTISQLGFMVVLFGMGIGAATFAGAAGLVAHALFKASLFMVVGIVDHGLGTRDVRRIPRHVGPGWTTTRRVAVVAAASMAGVPLTLGFVAKEGALDAAATSGAGWTVPLAVVLVVGSALTAAYAGRFVAGVSGRLAEPGTAPASATPAPRASASHPPGRAFVAVPVVLATATVVLGVVPWPVDRLVGATAADLAGSTVPKHLAIWHGLNLALGLSALALTAGAVIAVASLRGGAPARRRARFPSGDSAPCGPSSPRPGRSPAWSRWGRCPCTSG